MVKFFGTDGFRGRVGFAYDGSAGRFLAVDENGEPVDNDCIMYFCACCMAEREKLLTSTAVTTVMSNFDFCKAPDAKGVVYDITTVGDKYVCEYMTVFINVRVMDRKDAQKDPEVRAAVQAVGAALGGRRPHVGLRVRLGTAEAPARRGGGEP